MQEKSKQAFSATMEVTKQLITLSTALLTLIVTFKDKILPTPGPDTYLVLLAALVAHLVSIVFGILTIYAVINTLEDWDPDFGSEPTVRSKTIRTRATGQILLFILGLSLLMTYPFL